VVADLTDERPSCYYEAGYAEALRKPILFVASKESVINPRTSTKIHFDIHRNVNFFVNNDQLTHKLRAAIDKNKTELLADAGDDGSGADLTAGRQAKKVKSERHRPKRDVTLSTSRRSWDLNENERAVLQALARSPAGLNLAALAASAFPKLKDEKANSWARNSVRRPLQKGMIIKVGPGTYKIVSR
jgi:hypothetical protein